LFIWAKKGKRERKGGLGDREASVNYIGQGGKGRKGRRRNDIIVERRVWLIPSWTGMGGKRKKRSTLAQLLFGKFWRGRGKGVD